MWFAVNQLSSYQLQLPNCTLSQTNGLFKVT